MDYPGLIFLFSLLVLCLATQGGASLRKLRTLKDSEREVFGVVEVATLTLLGLIIGFSFSMAISRYDLRKTCEEAEANAIGTEYLRAGLLPAADAAGVRGLLRKYLDLRVAFYRTSNERALQQINADTAQLQAKMWSAVTVATAAGAAEKASAGAQPPPVVALAVSGINDVLNSQANTQAAWWNRIPIAAWGLMTVTALCCNLLVGYSVRGSRREREAILLVLPLVISISFFLIADIDSPLAGLIQVAPQNLVSLSQSLPK